MSVPIIFLQLLISLNWVVGFQASPPPYAFHYQRLWRWWNVEFGMSTATRLSTTSSDSSSHGLDNSNRSGSYDSAGALVKLSWEIFEEANARPILNLSSRDAPLEDDRHKNVISTANISGWDQGQLWDKTIKGLNDLGLSAPDTFLAQCPQLLRLPTDMVLETAKWIVTMFGTRYLESEPRLLCYRLEHVRYGLEFMSTMMMTDAKLACKASPALLLSGIEGGIQEQAVKAALRAAGAATSKASQSIAVDAMVAVKALQKRPKGRN